MEHPLDALLDTAAGVGAVTSPWWLALFNSAVQEMLLVGGLVLLALRIAIALRDLRRNRVESE